MSNLESVRGLYEAFAKGDVPTVLGFLSPNIAWTEAEGFPYGGTYNGPNAVLEGVFMRLGSEWDGFAAVPDEFIDAGDTIVVLGKYSGVYKATGKSFKANFAHVWKVREGRPSGSCSMWTRTSFSEHCNHRRREPMGDSRGDKKINETTAA